MLATTEASAALDPVQAPPTPSARRRVTAIARNTFREAGRDRGLYNLVLFVLLLRVSPGFLGAPSASQDAKTIVHLGLIPVVLFRPFSSNFVGVGLGWKEIE